jgi:predicted small metal-binding protein
MAKLLRCRDMGAECSFEACGRSEDEVLAKGAEHGRTEHGMTDISPELVSRARSAIRDVDSCPNVL